MALNDILIYDEADYGYPGDESYAVAASATTIKAGEPVAKALGNTTGTVVTPAASGTPVVATDYYAGIAASTSTNTATAAGTVKVTKMAPGVTYIIAPLVAATWNTQAKYDALVGSRVLFDLTSSTYTIAASDDPTYGCVIMPLDIVKYPKKVRFAFRRAVSYLA